MSPSAKLIVLTAPFTEMIEFYEGRPLQIKTRAELLVAIRPNYWKFFREDNGDIPTSGTTASVQPRIRDDVIPVAG